MTAIALTIAGSDSSGGAGIQADLKTFAALGVYGASAITAITAQNTLGVRAVHVVPPEIVLAQLQALSEDLEVGAIKIGMLANRGVIEAVSEGLRLFPGTPVVLDPVMAAASGDLLLEPEATEALVSLLFPLATLITPNMPEAAALVGASPAKDEEAMAEQTRELSQLGARAVLIKGGHAKDKNATDILLLDGKIRRFGAPRCETADAHGTGCTLSSAIAAELAKGANLLSAVERAKSYVTEAIFASDRLKVGQGRRPLHHFNAFWPKQR
jgi:hydroxymethylpyrimidine/phosphomethylpyrimidine kinase